jgi:hypothetical protein
VARDSLFGERIIWAGQATRVSTPSLFRGASVVLFILAAVSVSYAVALTLAVSVLPVATLVFALWCIALGFACVHLPRIWLSKVRYVVTEHHVISQRGPFRRTIERRSISFARIFWSQRSQGIGDIDLVRAVPTGALRRRLMLRLSGVSAPDRVWAIIRGQEDVAPTGHGERPLAQRLEAGERVIWSAQPRHTLRAYLPQGAREWALLGMAFFLCAVLVRMSVHAVPILFKLIDAGLPVRSFAFGALLFGFSASMVLILAIAVFLVYHTLVRPGRLVRHTRYLITDKRVLIQRSHEELSLDRSRIVDVIDAPAGDGLSHVFLVLDGPRARALAISGAFGELARGPDLHPVFESVEDAEGARRILRAA